MTFSCGFIYLVFWEQTYQHNLVSRCYGMACGVDYLAGELDQEAEPGTKTMQYTKKVKIIYYYVI